MNKLMIAALIGIAPLAAAAPAAAQNAAQNGILVIYGNDKCPTNTQGEEIVVCQRLDESERFRVPKTLRENAIAPQAESFAVRMNSVVTDNPTGTGSCTAIGPGGSTGCFVKEATAARRETKAREKDQTDLPLP
ncbi:MAG: hypothetical protein WDN44_08455 [Sphingomonas sp.]